jgi:hypothetical protein
MVDKDSLRQSSLGAGDSLRVHRPPPCDDGAAGDLKGAATPWCCRGQVGHLWVVNGSAPAVRREPRASRRRASVRVRFLMLAWVCTGLSLCLCALAWRGLVVADARRPRWPMATRLSSSLSRGSIQNVVCKHANSHTIHAQAQMRPHKIAQYADYYYHMVLASEFTRKHPDR